MGRASKNVALDSKAKRLKLPIQREPHWCKIDDGKHLGYRKTGEAQGTWIVRTCKRVDGKQVRSFAPLGIADDGAAFGSNVLSYSEALSAAKAELGKIERADRAAVKRERTYTVANAASDWLRTWRGSERGKLTATANVELHILPTLGKVEVDKLTRVQVERWLHDQAKKTPLKVQARQQATKKLSPSRQSKVTFDPSDPDTQRKRKDSANRVFRDLRALLNRAYDNQHVASKAPWDTIKEFDNVNVAKNEYLTLDEANRFLQECPQDFRNLVQAALITGCRYGELCSMKADAYDATVGALSVIQAKTGKMKRIFLTPEETAFFYVHTDGKQAGELMFRRADGEAWGKSHQQPRMESTLKAACIARHIRFHDLRHTFATLLAMNGTSLQLIANQLGHSGTRMAEKHYAHFSPSYVATTIRANKPSFAPVAPGPVLVSRAS